ncbi:MAG: hypothetical protein AAGI07_15750, partial [Bacteroidota bacterium]
MERSKKIDDYLQGRMNKTEVIEFEHEVSNDESLAADLEMQRLELKTINLMKRDALLSQMESYTKENPKLEKRKIRPLQIVKIAASILVIFTFFALWKANDYTNENIVFNDFKEHSPDFELTRTKSNNTNEVLFPSDVIAILDGRSIEDANTAITYFNQYESNDIKKVTQAKYNLAHAYLLNKEYTKS